MFGHLKFLNATTEKGVKSPQAREKHYLLLFFSVYQFASEGKTEEGREFTIAEGTVKICLLHFGLEPISFTSKVVSFVSMLSLVSTTGVAEVHLLCDFRRNICLVRFSVNKVLADVNNFLYKGRGVIQEEVSLPCRRLWPCNRVGTPSDTT